MGQQGQCWERARSQEKTIRGGRGGKREVIEERLEEKGTEEETQKRRKKRCPGGELCGQPWLIDSGQWRLCFLVVAYPLLLNWLLLISKTKEHSSHLLRSRVLLLCLPSPIVENCPLHVFCS